MKTSNKALTLHQLSYTERANSINVTAQPITEESPAWLIDNRTFNLLMGMIMPADLEVVKARLIDKIKASSTREELNLMLEEYMAVDAVANHPNRLAWLDHQQCKLEAQVSSMEVSMNNMEG